MVVVSRNKGGAYIICDLDGTLSHAPVAAFQIVPYFAHEHLNIPDLEQHIDVSISQLRKLEDTAVINPNYPEIVEVPNDTDDMTLHSLDNSNEEEET